MKKKTKANLDVRRIMKDHDVAQWELAEYFGVCEQTMIRWFRTELPQERKDEIIKAIQKIEECR